MDVGGWLRRLGLEQYEAAFRENRIDVTVLPRLTAEDLKDLGVGFVGDRRKLLDAIAALRAEASPPTAVSAAPLESDNTAKDAAERRQVTVMFSDLVGSTSLSAQMDPEDLREIISAYQTCVADTVRRFGGFVAKYMGDGVLIYFGYPQAHEDDAERAVSAALEVIAAVCALKVSIPLQARIGIATGLVIVGDLIGSGEAQERGVVGETPNLAARLQGLAEPNGVVIADSTRRLLGDLFELKDLGPRELKGIPNLRRAWVPLRPSAVEGRFEALHAGGLTELVGRQEEFELLVRRWSRAKIGEGQVVLLSGEAGIGKSRLTAAFLDSVANEPHTRLRYFCSPQHVDSAFYPIIGQMQRAAGLTHDETPQARLDKLDAVLAQTSTSTQDAALFADMLSLPNDGRYPALGLTPQQRRQKTLEALISQSEALTRRNPVLMIFEDAHWSDPTSLEVFGRVVDVIATLPVLLIVTFRPEFEASWIGRPYVSALTLNRLTERDVVAMIDRVIGSAPLPPGIRQDIIERTDGIPLFVEEMTKAVLEAGSEGEARRIAAAVPSPARAVPASLHASLMARLDRLGPAKEVAQIGAVIGREFSHALLAAVSRKDEGQLKSALDGLVLAGLLFRQGLPPNASYLFKHALVQDAAYGTLLRESRRALHKRIAETLESKFSEIGESQPELLARHYSNAELIEKAAWFWGKAGERSLARSAVVEACEQLNRALDLLATLPQTSATRPQQLKLQIAIANALMQVKGYAASEAKAAFEQARLFMERAEALGEAPEDPLLLFSFLWGVWSANFVRFNGEAMRSLASQFMALAERRGAKVPLMVGQRLIAMSALHTGDIAGSQSHFDRTIALYDPAAHRALAPRFGQDIRVAAMSFRALALWLLGYPELALADAERSLTDAQEINHGPTLMYALVRSANISNQCGNYAAASKRADEIVAFATQKGIGFWQAYGMLNQGIGLALTGNAVDAVQKISSAINVYRSMGSTLNLPEYLWHLAKAHAQLGQIDDAWRCVDEAITIMRASGETWCEAELHRVCGEIALMARNPDVAKAEAYFQRALSVARQQQAKSWELRAAMSLARLWRDQGKVQQARELLAPVYGWFTEGFDTRDLKEAQALLDDLTA